MGMKKEPVLVNKLKARKLVLKVRRPFREDILDRMAVVGTKLRNPEFVGTQAAASILGGVFRRIGRVTGVGGQRSGVRAQEPGEKRKTYPTRRTM